MIKITQAITSEKNAPRLEVAAKTVPISSASSGMKTALEILLGSILPQSRQHRKKHNGMTISI